MMHIFAFFNNYSIEIFMKKKQLSISIIQVTLKN